MPDDKLTQTDADGNVVWEGYPPTEEELQAREVPDVPVFGDIRDLLKDLPAQPYDASTYAASYVLKSDIFPVKHRLLRELDEKATVRKVVEFGPYFGAFCITALAACPNLRWLYTVDNETYTEGSNAMLRQNLQWYEQQQYHGTWINWVIGDKHSDKLGLLDVGPDLVHVDGDHSFGGCFLDLVLAWAMQPREIWVDDFRAIEDVNRATTEFAAHLQLQIEFHNTTNGLAVIRP